MPETGRRVTPPVLHPLQPCVSSLSSSTVHHSRRLTVAHGVTFTSSLTRRSPHLVGRHTQSLTALPHRALGLSPRPLTSVVVAVPCTCARFVVFLLLKVSVLHLVSISPFSALFVVGSRGNRSRWADLYCRLLASSLAVSFSLAISFSFAINFLRATRFGEFSLIFLLQFWCCINAL
ncbi:uncharacterized protein DS421_16g567520 [Arachis hypogaea]|nr:uncharacterized protein DS421_16g567520 [Arachis hypogaea]